MNHILNLQFHRIRNRASSQPLAKDEVANEDCTSNPSESGSASIKSRPSAEETQTPRSKEERRRARRRQRIIRMPRLSHPSAIVTSPNIIHPLHTHFPARYQACDWQNVYSTMRHGTSLHTFYANCAGTDPIVVIIRDDKGAAFGCYSSVPWKSAKQYYGNGEGFVFTINPKFAVYRWSTRNSFFQLGSQESIALGGGDKFALFLDSMLERGSSGPCATFDNPCLASRNEFGVVVLEAYKLVAPHRLKTIANS